MVDNLTASLLVDGRVKGEKLAWEMPVVREFSVAGVTAHGGNSSRVPNTDGLATCAS